MRKKKPWLLRNLEGTIWPITHAEAIGFVASCAVACVALSIADKIGFERFKQELDNSPRFQAYQRAHQEQYFPSRREEMEKQRVIKYYVEPSNPFLEHITEEELKYDYNKRMDTNQPVSKKY